MPRSDRADLLAAELRRNSARPAGEPGVRGRHDPGAKAATFATETWLDVAPDDLVALIREADLGPLAGKLSLWDVRSASVEAPWTQRILYSSDLPWPLRPRAFCVESRVELADGGEARIETTSVEPSAEERALAVRAEWGTVVYSGYTIQPERSGSRLRRVIEVELAMPWPRAVELAALARVYGENHAWLAAGRAHARGAAFLERKRRDPVYAAIASHASS